MLDKDEFKGVRLLTLQQTMRLLSIKDYRTLKKRLKRENIPIVIFGGSEMVDINDLEKTIDEKKTKAA